MKSGTCPKCKGKNIYANRNESDKRLYYGDRMNIQVPKFGLKALGTEIFICADCRYFEEYVLEDQDILRALRKWKKI